jgi:hypothetical protein
MDWLRKRINSHEGGAALLIVLAFVVLLTGMSVAYLSRTTSDRQVAHGSFNQSKADQLAASAMDNIIGDLRQEIENGSTRTTYGSGNNIYYVYTPTSTANLVPQRSGNLAAGPNLVRRSVSPDNIVSPGLPSFASGVNSAPADPANPRRGDVTKARWNKHYLIPKANTTDDGTDPIAAFTAPDWVFVTSDTNNQTAGRKVITSPDQTVIGRYAYAIYDESGLLDMNVAGCPTGTTPIQSGRKGSLAYADLTALGNYPIRNPDAGGIFQIDRLVGWRNYGTTQPSNTFPNSNFAANFQTDATRAAAYFTSIVNNTSGFLSTSGTTWDVYNNGRCLRTDQSFVQRQQLIAFRGSTGFSSNALQYLSTFTREANSPSWRPTGNATDMGAPDNGPGNVYAYADNANSSTAINPNFLLRRATTNFTRFDGTTAVVGEPLVKTRFPLSRLAWITYKGPSATLPTTDPVYLALINAGVSPTTISAGTAANIKACFGLTFPTGGAAGSPWTYTNPTGSVAANRILRLDEVAAAGREADFFELLQAGILNGSLGQNTALPPGTSGGGVTGQNNNSDGSGLVFPDIHMSNTTQHIFSIGAAIIDQADPDSIPMRIQFNPSGTLWTAYGVENLPYITEMYPIAGTSPNTPTQWATYLLFQLWNPHQNASTLPNNVRLRVDGAIGIFTGGNVGNKWISGTTPQLTATGQSVTLNSAFSFSAPFPLTAPNTTNAAPAPGPPAGGAFAVLPAIP